MNTRSELATRLAFFKHLIAGIIVVLIVISIAGRGRVVGGGSGRRPQPPDAQLYFSVGWTFDEIKRFEAEHGELREIYTDGTVWWQQLRDALYIQAASGFPPTFEVGKSPKDQFGNELVYEAPDIIRCVGPNGIDDKGSLDDWTFVLNPSNHHPVSIEPDWSLWYPDEYTDARFRAIAFLVLGSVLSPLLVMICWRRAKAFGISIGCLAFSLLLMQSRPPDVFIMEWPLWLESLEGLASMIVLFSTLAAIYSLLILVFGYPLHRFIAMRAQQENRCVKCGYDLAGLAGDVCPECGVGNS